MAALMFIAGIFVSLLPPRYRRWWHLENSTTVVSGLVQFFGCMLAFLVRLINFGRGSSEVNAALIRMADNAPGGRLDIATPAVGALQLVEFAAQPLNMLLFYMIWEGAIRAIGAVASGQSMGTLPLHLVSGIHGLLDKARHKRDLGPLVIDEVVRGTTKSNFDLKVYSCRPKLDWNPYITIEFEDQFYQMFKEEPGSSPRRFIYYLRKNPTGRIVVQVRHYQVDDVMKAR